MISRSNNPTTYFMLINFLFIISLIHHFADAQVCTPDVCNKHGTCIPNALNSFTCRCDPGFAGQTCNEEVNECASHPCANNGTCTDLENGFLCHCLPEWNGTLCTEPKNPCQSSPCGSLGRCIPTNHVQIPYYCKCPDGQNTMFKCPEPSPCAPNPCGPGECEITANILNGYICRCYDGTIQMTNCSAPKNPCTSMPCGPQGRCLALTAAPKGYMCMCQVDGVAYTTIDTCPVSSSFCTHMTCKNGGTCVPFSADEPSCNVGQIGSTCCQCPPDFTGLRCEQEVDFCSSNPCKANGHCISEKSGYHCQCFEGFEGENCDVRITNTGCASNPCTVGICYQLNQGGSSYVCICPDGTLNLACDSQNSTRNFYGLPKFSTSTITSLLLPDVVKFRGGGHLNSAPAISTCSPTARDTCNGGQCVLATNGVYGCRCREGYTGAYCENNINECASNPCLGGGTCYDLVNAYACFCPDRIFRPQCNTTMPIKHTMPIPIATTPVPKPDKTLLGECLCRNGGKCHTSSTSGKLCQCPTGYTGPFCEILMPNRINIGMFSSCSQMACENGATCQDQGPNSVCICKPGFTGQRCELEYFRCQGNGRFSDVSNCHHGRYFECVYYGQHDLNLPFGILYSRSCPPGLRFSALTDRCDYPSAVQC